MQGDWGLLVDGLLTFAVAAAIFTISRRNKINATNLLSEVEGASEVVLSARQIQANAKAQKKADAKSKKKSKKGKK
jgi:PiT family inorganic phosphate transporter